jgi:hypothetical protein
MYQSLDPGFYVWGEGCHERFGRAYDVHQGHGEEFTWQLGRSTPEQFLYTYPDALVTGHAKTGVQGLCWSHAQGKPFDVSSHNLDDAAFRELLERFVAVRKAWPQYFTRGLFRDDEDLRVAGDTRAFAIHRVDGNGILVNLWLPGTGLEQQCSELLQHPRPGWRTKVIDPRDAHVEDGAGWLAVSWRGPIVTLVFTPSE